MFKKRLSYVRRHYTGVPSLVHYLLRHVTAYACRHKFGPLTFSSKFLITWSILVEYAGLVHIQTLRIRIGLGQKWNDRPESHDCMSLLDQKFDPCVKWLHFRMLTDTISVRLEPIQPMSCLFSDSFELINDVSIEDESLESIISTSELSPDDIS